MMDARWLGGDYYRFYALVLLADRTLVTVELLSWLSSVCPSVRRGCTVAKLCKIGLRLLLITNRKWHIGYQET